MASSTTSNAVQRTQTPAALWVAAALAVCCVAPPRRCYGIASPATSCIRTNGGRNAAYEDFLHRLLDFNQCDEMKRGTLIGRMNQLLSGSLDLDKFEEWMVAHLDQSEKNPDPQVRTLLDRSDILLMRLRDGFIDAPEFVAELDAALREVERPG